MQYLFQSNNYSKCQRMCNEYLRAVLNEIAAAILKPEFRRIPAIECFYQILQIWNIIFKDITARKIKFSIKDFFRKCDQIRSFLRIWTSFFEKSIKLRSYDLDE